MTKPGHFQWTEESDSGFVATKQTVEEQVTTTFPAINADYSLAVDASDTDVGADYDSDSMVTANGNHLHFLSCN